MLQTKKSLRYLVFLILFVFIILFSKDLLFTQAAGSSSGVVTATVTVNPIKVDIQARPHSPFVNKKFKVQAKVENLGSTILNNVEATIFLPPELMSLSDKSQLLGLLDAGRKKRVSWDVRADISGNYIITVSVSAWDSEIDDFVTNQTSIVVEVKNKRGRSILSLFDFFFNIFR